MNFREILHYELWSKRTTRNILIGLGTVIALFVVGLWVWNEIELHWLTAG